MKRTLTIVTSITLAIAAHAQSNQRGTDGERSYSYGSSDRYSRDTNEQGSSSGNTSQVRRLNKASNLIGANVRDRSNQTVGEVKDVVIDFNSGRVAYVVVDASDVLDDENSLIAVPARVIRLNRNQRALTIDADRARIQQLQAFTENNFPAIRSRTAQMANWRNGQYRSQNNPNQFSGYSSSSQNRYRGTDAANPQSQAAGDDNDWYYYEWYLVPDTTGEAYSDNYNTGNYSSAGSTSGQGSYGQSQSGRSQPDDNSRSRYDSENSRSSGGNQGDSGSDMYTRQFRQQHQSDSETARRSRWETQMPEGQRYGANLRESQNQNQEGSTRETLSGWIRDIDEQNRSITVEGQNRTLNFKLAENAMIKENGRGDADLSDLHPGQRVDVGYSYQNGANRAFTINKHTRGAATSGSLGTEDNYTYSR